MRRGDELPKGGDEGQNGALQYELSSQAVLHPEGPSSSLVLAYLGQYGLGLCGVWSCRHYHIYTYIPVSRESLLQSVSRTITPPPVYLYTCLT